MFIWLHINRCFWRMTFCWQTQRIVLRKLIAADHLHFTQIVFELQSLYKFHPSLICLARFGQTQTIVNMRSLIKIPVYIQYPRFIILCAVYAPLLPVRNTLSNTICVSLFFCRHQGCQPCHCDPCCIDGLHTWVCVVAFSLACLVDHCVTPKPRTWKSNLYIHENHEQNIQT